MLAAGEARPPTGLRQADIVSLHLSLNDETRGFIDRAKLARTKPGVIIVNTAVYARLTFRRRS